MAICGYCGALIFLTCKDCEKKGIWGSKYRRDFPGTKSSSYCDEQEEENSELDLTKMKEYEKHKEQIDALIISGQKFKTYDEIRELLIDSQEDDDSSEDEAAGVDLK